MWKNTPTPTLLLGEYWDWEVTKGTRTSQLFVHSVNTFWITGSAISDNRARKDLNKGNYHGAMGPPDGNRTKWDYVCEGFGVNMLLHQQGLHCFTTIMKCYCFLYLRVFRASFPCCFHNKQLRGAVVLQFELEQGLASFFHKVPDSKHLWLYRHMVVTSQLCLCSWGIAVDTM